MYNFQSFFCGIESINGWIHLNFSTYFKVYFGFSGNKQQTYKYRRAGSYDEKVGFSKKRDLKFRVFSPTADTPFSDI